MNRAQKLAWVIVGVFYFAATINLLVVGGHNYFLDRKPPNHKLPSYTKVEALEAIRVAHLAIVNEMPNVTAQTMFRAIKLGRLLGSGEVGLSDDQSTRTALFGLGQYNVQARSLSSQGVTAQMELLIDQDKDLQTLKGLTEQPFMDWNGIGSRIWSNYPVSIMFAFLAIVGQMRIRRINILAELLYPGRFALALGLWWISWKWFPYQDSRERLTRVLHFATLAVTFLLSTVGGAAAQVVKKASSGKLKDKAEHALQVDVRNSNFTGDGPDPNQFLRVSFYEPRWLLETLNNATPGTGAWYNEIVGGAFVKRSSKVWLMPVVGVTQNHLNARSVIVGTELFLFTKLGMIAIPTIRYEHGIAGPPSKTFAFTANPNLRLFGRRRVTAAPELTLRKTLDKPLYWFAGSALRFAYRKDKSDIAEVGAFRNSRGELSVRARLIFNFAF